jgi:hypothetical protein
MPNSSIEMRHTGITSSILRTHRCPRPRFTGCKSPRLWLTAGSRIVNHLSVFHGASPGLLTLATTGASRYQLESSWEGYGLSAAKVLPETLRLGAAPVFGIHRFKVDEDAGLVIITHMFGGLTVLDLRDPDNPLWGLNTVRPYPCVK